MTGEVVAVQPFPSTLLCREQFSLLSWRNWQRVPPVESFVIPCLPSLAAHGWLPLTLWPWRARFTLRFWCLYVFFGVEKWFSLLFVCSGNVVNLICNFQSKFSLLWVFLQLKKMLLFNTCRRNGNLAIWNFSKYSNLDFRKTPLCKNFTLHGEQDSFIHLLKASKFELYHLVC